MQLSSSLWVRRLQAQLHSKLSPSVAPCLTCSCATSSMAAPIAFRFLCLGPPPRSLLWLDSSRVARRRMQEARSLPCWQCSAAPSHAASVLWLSSDSTAARVCQMTTRAVCSQCMAPQSSIEARHRGNAAVAMPLSQAHL